MYFPKSQITPNLYTNGGEFILTSTNRDYIGYYYKVTNGEIYTGKTPEDGDNILLKIAFVAPPIETETSLQPIQTYQSIYYKQPINKEKYLPYSNIPLPSPTDIEAGKFIRYFAKKTNELKYLEINQTTYTELSTKSKSIAWEIYDSAQIEWLITGPQELAYNKNEQKVKAIEQKQQWYGFSIFLKEDYLKYYQQ
jgi:hypothetical protein